MEIINFPTRGSRRSPSINTTDTPAKIHTLITKPKFHVYTERFTSRDVTAEGFFHALSENGSVTIITNGDESFLHSVLKSEKSNGETFEMLASDFIRLTEPVSGMAKAQGIDRYILDTLESEGIRIGLSSIIEETFSELILDETNVDDFRPENTMIAWDDNRGNDGFYTCTVTDGLGVDLSYSADDFADAYGTTLLQLLCHARQESIYNGLLLEGIEVTSYSATHTGVTKISAKLLDRVLFNSIARKYPLYTNIAEQKRLEKFHDSVIVPMLNEEEFE